MVRWKRSMKISKFIFGWICVYIAAEVDELKGHCAGYAEKE